MAKRKPIVLGATRHEELAEGDVLEVTVSPQQGNIIEQREDGLFAAGGGGGTDLTLDPNQFTTKTVGDKEVTTLKNDPDVSNQLSVIGSGGLFARPASAQVRAKDKSVRVAGIPQDKNGGFNTEISVQTIPVKENQLGIAKKNDTEGLYVRSTFEQLVSPNKTIVATKSTTEVAFEPSLTDIDVAISKADGNALAINEDGLFASGEGSPFVSIQPGYQTNVPAKSKVSSSIAIGESSEVDGNSALVIGARAKGKGDRNIVIGENANGNGSGQILIGSGVSDTWNNIIIGTNGSAKSGNSVLVGHGTKGAQKSIAIGAAARAEFEGAITIGESSIANVDEGVVVGPHAMVSHKGSAAFGAGSLTTRENTISFGTASHLRTLEHVAAGTELTDAVNLSQLQAETLVAKWQGGNISWNYNDAKTADNAAGHWGEAGCYLRFKVEVNAGDIIREVKLTNLPCRADGTIVNHQVFVTTPRTTSGKTWSRVTVLMAEIPTHIVDPDKLTLTLAGRADNGLQVGIPEIPVVESPGTNSELGYSVAYFQKKGPQM